MNKPLFEVGEHVIVDSQLNPAHNGEQIICDVSFKKLVLVSRAGIYEGWCYKIFCQEDIKLWYIEPSIKKKHKPSEMSFDGLMDFLKSPVKTA